MSLLASITFKFYHLLYSFTRLYESYFILLEEYGKGN